ncbi:MAG: hypothetical protein HRU28_08835 [Rhizobiales bacterium]|nr:hypothetical protein [Hyphomicrobiales bacterium]
MTGLVNISAGKAELTLAPELGRANASDYTAFLLTHFNHNNSLYSGVILPIFCANSMEYSS